MATTGEGPEKLEFRQRQHTSVQQFPCLDDDEFMMYEFKVKLCSIEGCQGPAKCPYVHPGEQGRRDPRRHSYSSDMCMYFLLNKGSCPHGDDCVKAHGCLEAMLHPSEYLKCKHALFGSMLFHLRIMKLFPSAGDDKYWKSSRDAAEFILRLETESNAHPGVIQSDGYPCHQPSSNNAIACDKSDVGYKPYLWLNLDARHCYKSYDPSIDYRNDGPYSDSYKKFDPSSDNYRNADTYNSKYKTFGPYLYPGKAPTLNGKDSHPHPLDVVDVSDGGYPCPQECQLTSGVAAAYNDYHLKRTPKHYIDFAIADSRKTGNYSVIFLGPRATVASFSPSRGIPNPDGVASSGGRLLADTGASIHAVGDYRLLRGVQLFSAPMPVTLPDGTDLPIVGIGRIEWEDFSIPNVRLIEGFQKNLISISQLDREHGMHSYFGKGRCEVMLPDGITRAGGAILEDDGMYVLRFLHVPERAAQA